MVKDLYLGQTKINRATETVSGEFVERAGEPYYVIRNYDHMPVFFTTVVSSSDHWFYIGSSGGLSCGRVDPDGALFPYYTVDKVEENAAHTGGRTIMRVRKGDRTYLWEPFQTWGVDAYRLRRHLYKSVYGDRLVFEEVNLDLGLTYSCEWSMSERFGFVRRCQLKSEADETMDVAWLDGLQNLLPFGATRLAQNQLSCLVDAYKKNELDRSTGLGLYAMSAILVDKAEPAECLKATVCWSLDLEADAILLSSSQLHAFRCGDEVDTEDRVNGVRGAYFLRKDQRLHAGSETHWTIVADVGRTAADIVALKARLLDDRQNLARDLERDINLGRQKLRSLVHAADGSQVTQDPMVDTHHFANVLFNIMRGGVFSRNDRIDRADFLKYLESCHSETRSRHAKYLGELSEICRIDELVDVARRANDPNLLRLTQSYLPLTFSRRHGDPSRPWNQFAIKVKHPDGTERFDYQGNWRDLFQNWEALGQAFPSYIKGMITRFVNASTPDGYNPYRIMKNDLEWEEPDPHDPWANIGYWGDHQIIYLLKLLEWARATQPELMNEMLGEELYTYADVPYEIKSYSELLRDSKDTIRFLEAKSQSLKARARSHGTDGKLSWVKGQVYHVGLLEKLLVPLLAKLSNFVPEGGIWLNTQRPEWNDANNALVGHGMSMVTVYYLRRHLAFLMQIIEEGKGLASFSVSDEVVRYFQKTMAAMRKHQELLEGPMSSEGRRQILDHFGQAGSEYRQELYRNGFSGQKSALARAELLDFFRLALAYIDHSIRQNRRTDGLYHSYNILTLTDSGAEIRPLYEMLEGQVAVLSSGLLQPHEALEVLKALRNSRMYREDQHSYMLYPERILPDFLVKNRLTMEQLESFRLFHLMAERKDQRLVEKDCHGNYHFHDSFQNADHLARRLAELGEVPAYRAAVDGEAQAWLELYEATFDHKAFTGRSGTFYGYEGIGCIYWHMVAKLLLAVEEVYTVAQRQGVDPVTCRALEEVYDHVRSGLGFCKSPDVWGAFPFDPYSHTPRHSLARQPGMTGQVKEEILTRYAELGVEVEDGHLSFRPHLLRRREFLVSESSFSYHDVHGNEQRFRIEAGSLAFTYCAVPIFYHLGAKEALAITDAQGRVQNVSGASLDGEVTQRILKRDGTYVRIDVTLEASRLRE